MAADQVQIATCNIDLIPEHPLGSGYYYEISFIDGTKAMKVGPYDTEADAEVAFTEALEEALTAFIAKGFGL